LPTSRSTAAFMTSFPFLKQSLGEALSPFR
jgi:hypothetical protein